MRESESHHSVSEWLTTVNTSGGSADTAWRHLCDRYAPSVTALARERLAQGRRKPADEEDVVVEVFNELFRGLKGDRDGDPARGPATLACRRSRTSRRDIRRPTIPASRTQCDRAP